jgi:septum formation protein
VTGSIVLASGSLTRQGLLCAAGVAFEADVPAVDENAVKDAMRQDGAAVADVAEALAEIKARQVYRRYPGRIVVGADQILSCDGVWFDKPADAAAARAQLAALRGRAHDLVSACVAVRDGQRLWHATDHARLTMRPFSDAFLDAYILAEGASVGQSVGGYRLEGPGIQLFAKVAGDHFTILGLPLLPLLEFLRVNGILAE